MDIAKKLDRDIYVELNRQDQSQTTQSTKSKKNLKEKFCEDEKYEVMKYEFSALRR